MNLAVFLSTRKNL